MLQGLLIKVEVSYFHLIQFYFKLRRHCAIEFEDEVIFTGSEDYPKIVSVYTIQGFKEHLPDLETGRYLHGCSYYTNNENKQVKNTFNINEIK